jgi:hypothetical protein
MARQVRKRQRTAAVAAGVKQAAEAASDGTPPLPSLATRDTSKMYQTIEGLGGAIAFYNGWVTVHHHKQEIYTNAFAGLNLSMAGGSPELIGR